MRNKVMKLMNRMTGEMECNVCGVTSVATRAP